MFPWMRSPSREARPMSEPWALGIAQAAKEISARRLTPVALVEDLLARAEQVDRKVRAWIRIAAEGALADARTLGAEAAAGRLRGPLHGVPIGIKDIVDTAGLETSAGSELLAGNIPSQDAPVVRRLRDAGAIVLGKAAMTEFASMDPAATRNPWNLEHTPGGSSSGSAAAVAAFLVPGTIGTQTAGSILRPAAYCGVVGLKPTYEAVERAGVFPCAWSMDHVGPLARTVEDTGILFRAMARPSAVGEGVADSRRLRIGIADRYFGERSDADTSRSFDAVVAWLRNAGADVVPVRLPVSFEAGVDAGIVTVYAEMASVHRQSFAAHRARYGWRIGCLLDAGGKVSATDYLRAQQLRRIAAADLSAMLAGVDCLMTSTTPAPAPRGLGATGDWTYNLPFSSSGHPSLSVPVALSASGMPIGVQLVARHRGEELLFRCGRLVEQLVKFPRRTPCP
jgi:aspartyl-tRNA(Asn)/glutamyl-tRNA(Gln) amidotransferase subunit A